MNLHFCRFYDRRPETKAERRTFAAARRAEAQYARQLRGVARAVQHLVIVMGDDPDRASELEQALRNYSDVLRPWARVAAERMLADVMRRDEAVWKQLGKEMGRALREEIQSAPTGEAMRIAMARQVELITSLPLDAARRVHELATGALYGGARPAEIREQIMLSGHVTRSRADLIARTETSRASTELTKARAEHVGSEGYVWRTAEDARVRDLHKKLAGKFIRWDDPPVAGPNGERAHAGAIFNCRCWCEVVVPDEAEVRRAA
jgi:SPP1 gp7 family putative phage head morphogenesis protein